MQSSLMVDTSPGDDMKITRGALAAAVHVARPCTASSSLGYTARTLRTVPFVADDNGMGSSVFADESGDESARERSGDGRRRSVFRRRDDDGATPADGEPMDPSAGDVGAADDRGDASDDEPHSRERDGTGDETMTVFSGDEVYELAVDDE